MKFISYSFYYYAVSFMLHTRVSAFCTDHTHAIPGPANPVVFDNLNIYQPGNKTFSMCTSAGLPTPSCGFYWISIALDVPANTQAHVKLQGSPDTLSFIRTFSLTGTDTMSNAGAVHASYDGESDFSMSTAYAAAAPSATQQTYMAGFHMNEVLSPLVAVNVARRTEQAKAGLLVYDRIMVDTAGAWDAVLNTFTAPQKGLYFFRYGVGTTKFTGRNVSLSVNGQQRQQLIDGAIAEVVTAGDGVDVVGRTYLTDLNKGDSVSISYTGSAVFSDAENMPTAFSGFLYSPISGVKVAWSVSRTEAETTYRLITQVTFQHTDINVGGAWQTGKNQQQAVIPVAGAYYIYLDVAACSSGAVQVDVRVNDKTVFSVNYDVSNGPLGHSRGNGAIVHVYEGDKITIWADKSTCIYGGAEALTTFTGQLLVPCGMIGRQNSVTFNAVFVF